MASASGAFGIRAGYNQSGGGYLMIVSSITRSQLNIYTPGSGTGASMAPGSFTQAGPSDVPDTSVFEVGHLLKDMGRTVVSSGRTFRKVQAVIGMASGASPTYGVGGQSPNYTSFYVETGREGAGANAGNLPLVVRYL